MWVNLWVSNFSISLKCVSQRPPNLFGPKCTKFSFDPRWQNWNRNWIGKLSVRSVHPYLHITLESIRVTLFREMKNCYKERKIYIINRQFGNIHFYQTALLFSSWSVLLCSFWKSQRISVWILKERKTKLSKLKSRHFPVFLFGLLCLQPSSAVPNWVSKQNIVFSTRIIIIIWTVHVALQYQSSFFCYQVEPSWLNFQHYPGL